MGGPAPWVVRVQLSEPEDKERVMMDPRMLAVRKFAVEMLSEGILGAAVAGLVAAGTDVPFHTGFCLVLAARLIVNWFRSGR